MPIIPVTPEVEIRRITMQASLSKKLVRLNVNKQAGHCGAYLSSSYAEGRGRRIVVHNAQAKSEMRSEK
jgi:hypothetical protein